MAQPEGVMPRKSDAREENLHATNRTDRIPTAAVMSRRGRTAAGRGSFSQPGEGAPLVSVTARTAVRCQAGSCH